MNVAEMCPQRRVYAALQHVSAVDLTVLLIGVVKVYRNLEAFVGDRCLLADRRSNVNRPAIRLDFDGIHMITAYRVANKLPHSERPPRSHAR